jgi:hypothetical protein
MLKDPDSERVHDPIRPTASPGPAAGPGGDDQARRGDNAAAPGNSSSDGLQVLSQVALALAASGMRYWGRSAELWAKGMPVLVQGFAQMTTGQQDGGREACRTLLDELRAYVRELAELPAQEARRLQADLDRIAGAWPSGAPPGGPQHPDAPWRRWDVKP